MEYGKQMQKSFLFSSWESFLERCGLVPRNKSMYSLLTFELLRILHVEISKLVKEFTILYLFSDTLKKIPDVPAAPGKSLKYSWNGPIRECKSILAAIGKVYYVPRLYIDFSKKRAEKQLDRLYRMGGLQGILEEKNYRNVFLTFPILTAFINGCTWWI